MWVILTARAEKTSPSKWMKIKGEARSRAFDLACSSRFLRWENERKENELKAVRYNLHRAIVSVLSDQKLFDESEVPEMSAEQSFEAKYRHLPEIDGHIPVYEGDKITDYVTI